MRTLTHTHPDLVRLTLELGAGVVEVHAEDRPDTVVTLAPVDAGDRVAADLIAAATHHSHADGFAVTLPRPAGGGGGTTVVQSGRGIYQSVAITGNVSLGDRIVGMDLSAGGVTIVNGQVISGTGTTIVGSGGGVRVVARVPAGSAVVVTTDSADLNATRLDTVTYQSASGDLWVQDARQVRAHTASGDVEVYEAQDVTAQTSSGDVRCGQVARVEAQTASGQVRVDQLTGSADVRTASGRITVHAVADATVTAHTYSGAVRVSAMVGVRIGTRLSSVTGRVHPVQVGA